MLGVGIGITTAMFTIVDALILRCTPQEFASVKVDRDFADLESERYDRRDVIRTALALLTDLLRLLRLIFQSRAQLAAENLFLRKQLACYIDRNVRPRRADNPTRVALVLLSRCVAWRQLLTIVRPDTLVRWHRDLYRLVWRAKSRPRVGRGYPSNSNDSSQCWPPPIERGVRSASPRSFVSSSVSRCRRGLFVVTCYLPLAREVVRRHSLGPHSSTIIGTP